MLRTLWSPTPIYKLSCDSDTRTWHTYVAILPMKSHVTHARDYMKICSQKYDESDQCVY